MRIKRTNNNYGGGSGRETFRGRLFIVVAWNMSGGKWKRTTIECINNSFKCIQFDGIVEFKSDKECMAQLNISEIFKLIKYNKDEAYYEGRQSKIEEFQKFLEV